ncbi:NRX2A protein, partial [Galbula dea]|nr:NRX2A protein [Galbula dea]
HLETKASQGSMANQGFMVNKGFMATQGSEDHLETKASQGSVANEVFMATQGFVVNQGSEDHLETKAHQGSMANLGFQDHPDANVHDSSMDWLELKVCQGPTANQGPKDYLETKVNQGPMACLGLKVHRGSLAKTHLKIEVHQSPVALKGHESSMANHSQGSMVHLEPKVNQGSTAHLVLEVHQDFMTCQTSEEHLETKVNQGSTAHREAKVNQGPRDHREAKVNQGPRAHREAKVNQGPTAHREAKPSEDHLETKVNPEVNQDPVTCLDLKFHQDSLTNRGSAAHLGTKFHHLPVANQATPPLPRPRISSGTHLGLVLVTLGSLLLPGTMGVALEFGGIPGQWARYSRWAPGAGGQLSFSVKTNISRALLLYLDDGGNCDFLELLVAEGRLRLRFAIACAEPATVHPPLSITDGRWHMVLLTRNARETSLTVDGE